jgi:uncharacterized delta-60 repeat protein
MANPINPVTTLDFEKYLTFEADSAPAKIGHVNYAIRNVNRQLGLVGGSYKYLGNSSVVTNIDWSQANIQELNLDNNPTITMSNGVLGKSFSLLLKQGLVGQRNVTWASNVIWSGGLAPTLQSLLNVTLDASFPTGTGLDNNSFSVAVQSDGKVLVGGSFSSYKGTSTGRIIRINTDGSLDGTFALTGTGFNSTVTSIVVQPDGKILVGGSFTTYNGGSCVGIARLNSNGTLDATFVIGSGFGGVTPTPAYSGIILQSDGKIIVAGDFTSYNGTTVNRIVRLNSDGTIDGTFTIGTGFNSNVTGVGVQSDGKILAGGFFNAYNGTSSNNIIRLNTNGTVDGTFSVGTGLNNVARTFAFQSDGKILVGGDFSSYNGTSATRIIRLNSNGTADGTFVTGTGCSNTLWDIIVQPNGKILIGGQFATYNGVTVNFFTRLNTDGTIDPNFTTGTGINSVVTGMVLQPDGKIITVGYFTTYNGATSNRIARFNVADTINAYNLVYFLYNGTDYIGSY